MSIRRLIKYFDIFGEKIELNIKRKNQSQTFFGGVLTIITCGLLIGAGWSTGSEIFYKQQPSTDIEDQLYIERPTYHLDKHNFPIALCYQDYDQKTYDIPRYLKYEVINVKTFNANSTTVYKNYEYENCTYDHFPNFSKEYLDTAGLSKYYCLKDQNVTLSGYWDNEYLEYMIFRIRLCNNATDGDICAPIDEIAEFITERPRAWNAYFQNAIINPRNYTDPTQYYIYNFYKNVRITTSKVSNVFVRSQEIETDVGILFESLSSDVSYAYDTSDGDDNDFDPNTLMDINFFVANHKPIFHRKYLKAQTFIANMGGLAKALILIMYLLCFYFSTVRLNTAIMNKILDYQVIGDEDKGSRATINTSNVNLKNSYTNAEMTEGAGTRIIGTLTTKQNNYTGPENLNNLNKFKLGSSVLQKLGQGVTIQNDLLIKVSNTRKHKKLKLSFLEIIRKPCCDCFLSKKSKNKYSLYDKSNGILLDYLDISNIVFKLEEFDKFKLIMLNQEQLAMFQFISKEVCTLQEKLDHDSELRKLKALAKDKNELLKLLLEYKRKFAGNKESMSSVDSKLFNMLDEDIRRELK
jgi:hypothetical protein